MLDIIREQARQAITELLAQAKLAPGALFVVGCSTSEMMGSRIGKASNLRPLWRPLRHRPGLSMTRASTWRPSAASI